MNIRNLISADEVLQVLNREPPTPSAYLRFVQAYWKGTYPDASPQIAAQFSGGLHQWRDTERNFKGRHNHATLFFRHLDGHDF